MSQYCATLYALCSRRDPGSHMRRLRKKVSSYLVETATVSSFFFRQSCIHLCLLQTYLYILSCRTKLCQLLCLKYRGNIALWVSYRFPSCPPWPDPYICRWRG